MFCLCYPPGNGPDAHSALLSTKTESVLNAWCSCWYSLRPVCLQYTAYLSGVLAVVLSSFSMWPVALAKDHLHFCSVRPCSWVVAKCHRALVKLVLCFTTASVSIKLLCSSSVSSLTLLCLNAGCIFVLKITNITGRHNLTFSAFLDLWANLLTCLYQSCLL